jgi:16S rRNA (adenine1518-N6/adenine1519-N6)-dimethyltransferase
VSDRINPDDYRITTKNRHKRAIGPETQRPQKKREPSAWWSTLNDLGIQPSKALGQNFLHDRGIVRRIAEAADISGDDLAVEVGPGLGVLTQELAERAGRVIAIELDHRLAAYLRERDLPCTEIVESDILETDLGRLTNGRRYIVVANLPYSVAAAAISHLLESPLSPVRLVVMVQREVAERIVAAPPSMNLLAVSVQLFGRARIMFTIGPGAFVPAPTVESAVIRIDVFAKPAIEPTERKAFFQMVKAGFRQKRKQLANALASAPGLSKEIVEPALIACGIDPARRAQTLSLDEWVRLHAALNSARSDE